MKPLLIPVIFLSIQPLSSSNRFALASVGRHIPICSVTPLWACLFIDMHSSSSSVGILQIMACMCVLYHLFFFNENDNFKIFCRNSSSTVKKFQHVGQGHLWVTKFHGGVSMRRVEAVACCFSILRQVGKVGNKENSVPGEVMK